MKQRVIVSDTSCLIDLNKHKLLHTFLKLPFEIVVPDVMFEEELLDFSNKEKRALRKAGLIVAEFTAEEVAAAAAMNAELPALSLNDCFAITLALAKEGCVLLSGDARLRKKAESHKVDVHGLLWAFEQLLEKGLVVAEVIYAALLVIQKDDKAHLPKQLVAQMLAKLAPKK